MIPKIVPTEFRLRTLGELSLDDAKGSAIKLRTRKALLLLACLAVDPDRVWTRDRLASVFWGDRMEKQAKSSLRSALSDIRRGLGDQVITATANSVHVNSAMISSDIQELRQTAQSGKFDSADWVRDVFFDDFLSELDTDEESLAWVLSLRSEVKGFAQNALNVQIELLANSGSLDPAIQYARQLLALDPLREESHRMLMRLYASNGERSKAISQYQNCRQLSLHELNVEPSAETKALADEIAVVDTLAIPDINRLSAEAATQVTDRKLDPQNAKLASLRSVAILPFVNMSGDADQDYFVDGIAEDIATDLSQVPDLDVTATSSTSIYKGARISPDQVARELGVQFVLEGSVRKYDRNIRATIRLVDGETNRQIWAERYDRELVNFFELQSEISSNVVSALQVHFIHKKNVKPDARGTRSIQAHESYLRGRSFLKEMTQHSVELSLHSFQQAIDIDPDYALALAGFSESVAMLGFHHTVSDEKLVEARINCEKALQVDPELAEAHCSLGRLSAYHKDFELAERQFQMAFRLKPDLQEAHLYRGLMYLIDGYGEKAYPSLLRAYELNDQDLQTGMMLLTCQYGVGEQEKAQRTARSLFELCRKRIALNSYDDRAIYVGAMALAQLGKNEEASRWAQLAATFELNDGRATYNIACLFGLLNDFDNAARFLRQTLELGVSDHKLKWMRYTDQDFKTLRENPEFDEIFVEWQVAKITK